MLPIKIILILLVVCIIIWVICRWLKFSIIPKSFVVPTPKPAVIKFPKIKKLENGRITVESSEDSGESSSEDSSEDSSSEEYSSESSDDSEEESSDDDEFY